MKNVYKNVTIAIPSKNSESNISFALESVKNFKNVFVIDSNSTDKTIEIAERFNANIVNFTWNGKYPKKRNWFLDQGLCKTEWVMFLDCDEVLTEAFINNLEHLISKKIYSGFIVAYNNYFMGKALKFGIPFKKLSVFKPSVGRYQKVEVEQWSKFDMEIHEHPQVEGKVGKVKSRVKHYDYRGIDHHLDKHHSYAKFESRKFLEKGYASNNLTVRQKIKYKLMGSFIFPFFYFFLEYFVFLGFLNGKSGLVYSSSKLMYFLEIYILVKSKDN